MRRSASLGARGRRAAVQTGRGTRRVLAGPLLAAAAAAAFGCASSAQPPRNILLIVIDTLRADRLGCYGAERDTSPSIDALAATGVRFARAYSTAPWTVPSVASLLTGLYPRAHGARDLPAALPEDLDTLAEILSAQGYETAGVVKHILVSSELGFAQGFATYADEGSREHDPISTPEVTRRALELLETLVAGERPFFLFVHYFDPHFRYIQHPDVHFAAERAGRLRGGEPIEELRAAGTSLAEEEVRFLRDLYDEEIRFTDDGVGRLLDGLEALGAAEETVVVLTSDHGEELLERGWLGHTVTLYEELIRVPLIVRAPSVAPGVVSQPVSLVSIPPTVLELAGIDPGERAFQGRSLVPWMRAGAPPPEDDYVFAEQTALTSVVGERFKLIRNEQTGALELYDLAADPGERRDLAGERPVVRERLLEILEDRARLAGDAGEPPRAIDFSELELEALRELGYLDTHEAAPRRAAPQR